MNENKEEIILLIFYLNDILKYHGIKIENLPIYFGNLNTKKLLKLFKNIFNIVKSHNIDINNYKNERISQQNKIDLTLSQPIQLEKNKNIIIEQNKDKLKNDKKNLKDDKEKENKQQQLLEKNQVLKEEKNINQSYIKDNNNNNQSKNLQEEIFLSMDNNQSKNSQSFKSFDSNNNNQSKNLQEEIFLSMDNNQSKNSQSFKSFDSNNNNQSKKSQIQQQNNNMNNNNQNKEIYDLLKDKYNFILNDDTYENMNLNDNEENRIVNDFIKDKNYNIQDKINYIQYLIDNFYDIEHSNKEHIIFFNKIFLKNINGILLNLNNDNKYFENINNRYLLKNNKLFS